MLGHIAGFLWMLTFWVFILSVFVLPIVNAYWRAREKADAAETERVLGTLGFDTSHMHDQDAVI